MLDSFSIMSDSKDCYFNEQPQTKRGAERCSAFLEAATDLFMEKGFDAVSLDDIVQHAGGSKSSLYKFFGNKEGLFTAICDHRRDIFLKEIYMNTDPEALDIRSFLITLLKNFHRHLVKPNNAQFFRLMLERIKHNPDLADYLYTRGPERILHDTCTYLEKATQQGLIVCDQPMASAKVFLGCLWNFKWKMMTGVSINETAKELDEYVEYCVNLFLKAHEYKQNF
jgi:TetR/AcrR family transcriptional regulator, repressor of the adeIJK operon